MDCVTMLGKTISLILLYLQLEMLLNPHCRLGNQVLYKNRPTSRILTHLNILVNLFKFDLRALPVALL